MAWGVLALISGMCRAAPPQADGLEQRVAQLERLVQLQQAHIGRLEARLAAQDPPPGDSPPQPMPPVPAASVPAPSPGADRGLDISGFFDVQATTTGRPEGTFRLGDLEMDLEYLHDDHFAAGAALVWNDDDGARVAVAVLDYHQFDDRIPARGRIFFDPGLHVQVGRFDLPFGTDYHYYAAADRPNVSAPLTTERIQDGGYNGDGLRVYGTWHSLDTAVFWTDSLFQDGGWTLGGRLGVSLGSNPFSFHHRDRARDLDLGFSYLEDREDGRLRTRVYALDLTLSGEWLTLAGEAFWRDDRAAAGSADASWVPRDEHAWHLSLWADLQGRVGLPLTLFGRYEYWRPDYGLSADPEDPQTLYAVGSTPRLTLGLGYRVSDYFQLKVEYYDYLGSRTAEPDFDGSVGTAQLVARF